MEILAKSEDETIMAAFNIADEIHDGDCILLYGNLGSGKTVFARALIRALSDDSQLEVPSPTFTLLQNYEGKNFPIWHYDLYRLKDTEEIYEIGWEDSLTDGVIIVEWPQRLGELLPARHLAIQFSAVKNEPNSRKININRVE